MTSRRRSRAYSARAHLSSPSCVRWLPTTAAIFQHACKRSCEGMCRSGTARAIGLTDMACKPDDQLYVFQTYVGSVEYY
jgi:hypothetical protein